MNNLLETKTQRIEYGESAEHWVVNKINSLNLPNWEVEFLQNRYDIKRNHNEGDILLKYKLDNQIIPIYIDVKASTGTYDYPVIKVNYMQNNQIVYDTLEYFKDVTHNFYLGIGRYDKNLENDTNIEFSYSLGITKRMIEKMTNNNCEFVNQYKKSSNKHDGDFISMKYFVNENDKSFMPVGERTTLLGVLDVIEKYIKICLKIN